MVRVWVACLAGLVAAAVAAGTGEVAEAATTCTGVHTGQSFNDTLIVMPGQRCELQNSVVAGGVVVYPGGAFSATGTTIRGPLTATGAAVALQNTTVGGNVVLIRPTDIGNSQAVRLCGATIIGSLVVRDAVGPATISIGGYTCEFLGNTVSGSFVDANNRTGATSLPGPHHDVGENTIRGAFTCTGNTPTPTGENNTASSVSAQCLSLKPTSQVVGPFVSGTPNHAAWNLGRLERLCTPSPQPNPTAAPPGPPAAGGLTVARNFDGLQNHQTPEPAPRAADTNGAVGPNHYVEMINRGVGIFLKDGTGVCTFLSTGSFFTNPQNSSSTCASGGPTDGVVIFDARDGGRWVATRAFRTQKLPSGAEVWTQCVAVSETADPTGAYHRYEFQISGTEPCSTEARFASCAGDYPKIAAWADGYYLTAASRRITGHYNGIYVLAFERDKMLRGADARAVEFYLPNPTGRESVGSLSHMLPAHWDGTTPPPPGSPDPFIEGFGFGAVGMWAFDVDWANPAASTFTRTNLFTNQGWDGNTCGHLTERGDEYRGSVCLDQPPVGDRTQRLAALNEGHPMFRLAYRNRGGQESLVTTFTVDASNVGDTTGIRWYELRRAPPGWAIHQTGTYAPPDKNGRWLGSMAMDRDGNILVGYNVSGLQTYPSIRVAGRTPTDPLGTLPRGEVSLVEGMGTQLGDVAFNDYTEMTIDPVDDCTFWFVSAYYPNQGTADRHNFHTRIGAVRFPSCSGGT